MALELEALLFSVDSKPLEEAINKANQLTQAVQNLNKASQDSTKAAIDEAKVRVQLAKVAAEEAKAKIQNAKAEEAENKTKEAKLRLTEKEEKTRIQNEAAIRKESDAQAKQITILEKQSSVLDFMAQGFSKGQSGVLAMAQAAGLATNQMQELMDVLKQQRALMGANPFDKSQQGLTSLENQFKALNEATRQYNINSGLTREQTRELSRDKERIALIMQKEGKSINEVVLAQAEYANKYAAMANKVNALANAEKSREAGMREQANAIKAVAAAEERMKNSLEMINSYQGENIRMNERAALAMGSFERNLRLAGITGDEAAKKLRAYKAAQEAVTEAEAQRAKNHLARGMTTQLGDIGISLWSGQNPLTVMLQQGDQVRDLIARSGVQGKELEKVMGAAVTQMAGSFAMLGTAVSAFIGGALEGLGNFILKITMVEKVVNSANSAIDKAFTGKFAENLKSVVSGIAPLLGFLSGSLLAFGAAFAVAAVQTSNASDDMMKSIVRFGAAQGLTLDQAKNKAIEYSESTKTSMTSAMEFIGAFAKSGITDMDQYDETIKTAILMQKEFGVSAEDSAKLVKDIYDKPLETLIKIAQETGLVNVAQLEKIRLLEEEGKHHEANKYALEVYNSAMKNLANEADANLSPLGRLWKDIKQATSDAWGEMQRMSESSVWTSLGKVFNYLVFSIKQILNGIGGIGTAIVKASSGDISGAIDLVKQIADNSNLLYQEYLDKNIELDNRVAEAAKARSAEVKKANAEDAKSYSEYSKEIKKIQDKIDKVKPKRYQSEAEFIKASMAEEAKAFKDGWKLVSDEKKKELEAYYSQVYKDAHKGKSEAEKDAEKLAKARLQDMKSLMDIGIKYQGHLNKLTDAEIRYNQIVSHEDYKKKYNTAALQEELKKTMEIAKARELASRNTALAIEIDKSWLEVTKQLAQQSSEISKRNTVVDNELRIVGLVGKEREKATREIELQNKYAEEELKFAKNKLDIEKEFVKQALKINEEKLTPEDADARRLQNIEKYLNEMTAAEKLLADGRLVSQREVNKKVVEDWFKEFNRITDGLTDVLVTALTEGGAAGGKKFREMIQAELKKPFVAVINAIVRDVSMMASQALGIAPSGVSTGSSILGMFGTASNINSAYNLASGSYIQTAQNTYNSYVGGTEIAGTAMPYWGMQGAGVSGGVSTGLVSAQSTSALTSQGIGATGAANGISGGISTGLSGSTAGSSAALGVGQGEASLAAPASSSSAGAGLTAGTTVGALGGAYLGYKITGSNYGGAALGGVAGYGAAAGLASGTGAAAGAYSALAGLGPYGWAAIAALALYSAFAGKGGGKKFEGDARMSLQGDYLGNEGYYTGSSADSIMQDFTKVTVDTIRNSIKDMGGDVSKATGSILLGFNTDPKGKAPDNISGAVYDTSGNLVYSHTYDADRGKYQEELQKESQRVIIAALKQVDLVDWADSVLARIDPLNASAEELANGIKNLSSMQNLVGIFEGLGLRADNLSMSFIDLFGGFDAATQALNNYYENFYTAEEKKARILNNIATELNNAGAKINGELLGKATREQFRQTYEEVVKLQGAGSDLAVALLKVSGAFASVTEATVSTTDNLAAQAEKVKAIANERAGLEREYANAIGDTTYIRNEELAALDPTNRALKERIYALQDAKVAEENANKAAQDAMNKLKESITAEKKRLQDELNSNKKRIQDNLKLQLDANNLQINAAQQLYDSIKRIADIIASALDSVKVDSFKNSWNELVQARGVISSAVGSSDLTKVQGLEKALDISKQDTKQFYSTFEDYARDQLKTRSDIESLNATATAQLTWQENIVINLKKINDNLQKQADDQIAALETQYDQQVKSLDLTLESYQKQLDALLGIDNRVLTVAEAINNLQIAIMQAQQSQMQSMQGAGTNRVQQGAAPVQGSVSSTNLTQEGLYTGTTRDGDFTGISFGGVPTLTDSQKEAFKLFSEAINAGPTDTNGLDSYNMDSLKAFAESNGMQFVADIIYGAGSRGVYDYETVFEAIAGGGTREGYNQGNSLQVLGDLSKYYTPATQGAYGTAPVLSAKDLAKVAGSADIVGSALNILNSTIAPYTTIDYLQGNTTPYGGVSTGSGTTGQLLSYSQLTQDPQTGAWQQNISSLQNPVESLGGQMDQNTLGYLQSIGVSSGTSGLSAADIKSNVEAAYASYSPEVAAQMVYDGAIAHGVSSSELAQAMGVDVSNITSWVAQKGLPAFANGGDYKGGLALVGENGPELINFNKSGFVYNANQTADILQGSSDSLNQRIESLVREIEMLRYEARATAVNTSKMAKQLDRSSDQGDTLRVTVVA